jgi:hypothetical protein
MQTSVSAYQDQLEQWRDKAFDFFCFEPNAAQDCLAQQREKLFQAIGDKFNADSGHEKPHNSGKNINAGFPHQPCQAGCHAKTSPGQQSEQDDPHQQNDIMKAG